MLNGTAVLLTVSYECTRIKNLVLTFHKLLYYYPGQCFIVHVPIANCLLAS